MQDSSSSIKNVECEHTCTAQLSERFNKLEQLFEKFVCRKPASPASSSGLSRSPTLVDSEKSEFAFGLPPIENDTQSISSIGHGIVSASFFIHMETVLIEDSSRNKPHGMIHPPSGHITKLMMTALVDARPFDAH